jgi:hypothetical protein
VLCSIEVPEESKSETKEEDKAKKIREVRRGK